MLRVLVQRRGKPRGKPRAHGPEPRAVGPGPWGRPGNRGAATAAGPPRAQGALRGARIRVDKRADTVISSTVLSRV